MSAIIARIHAAAPIITLFRAFVARNGAAVRDSRGRFVKGNPYRFTRSEIAIAGESYPCVMQNALYGSYFRVSRETRRVNAATGEIY